MPAQHDNQGEDNRNNKNNQYSNISQKKMRIHGNFSYAKLKNKGYE